MSRTVFQDLWEVVVIMEVGRWIQEEESETFPVQQVDRTWHSEMSINKNKRMNGWMDG